MNNRGGDVRTFAFELVRDTSGSGDGLTFQGYAAVFNRSTTIDSWDGPFEEIIRQGAFKRTLEERTPVLMFEHGRHPLVGSMPLGVITTAREDKKGLFIEARLTDNWLIQPVRDAVRDGAVDGMSFRFTVPTDGEKWTERKNQNKIDLRELLDINVPELGPVVFPAYEPTTASIRSLVESLPEIGRRPASRATDATIEELVAAADALIDEIEEALESGDITTATALVTALDETIDGGMTVLGIPDTDENDVSPRSRKVSPGRDVARSAPGRGEDAQASSAKRSPSKKQQRDDFNLRMLRPIPRIVERNIHNG